MLLKLRTPGGEADDESSTLPSGPGATALQMLPARLREYFRYHGLLAPGVRLMRALSVRGKAALLATTFVLPLALTLPHVLRGEAVSSEQLRGLLMTLALCLGVALYMLLSFYRVTHGGLAHLNEQVGRMATGDLSMRPRPWGDDEIARAMHSLGQSLARLADLFAVVRQGVSASSHASREIASGNEDLSRRTVQAAEAIEGVLRGVGQYIEQLDACGERVDAAEAVVQRMRVDAAHARHQMQQLESRMQAMQDRSREIGEIVELIDNLAFRTNILALNASIEAAKAGEAGRGFAVVAQEVRGLAQRSAESAQRIGDIIGRSTDDIGQAGLLAGETGKALGRTDGQVDQIHDEMVRIVELTRAGQASSQDILAGLRSLSELTQDNRRMVEQMAVASSALSGEGERLARTVGGFKLT